MKHRTNPLCLAALFAAALSSISIVAAQDAAPPPASSLHFSKATDTIYVTDFDLDPSSFEANQGPLNNGQSSRPHIIQGPRARMAGTPQEQAQKLVNLMATSIVQDLTKAGYHAQYLPPGTMHPVAGLWVHGVFTELNEGNRLQRAVIGFGAGEAKMDLYVTMSDLSEPEKPLYNMASEGASKKTPGAAITMNPYAAAAKFVMEKNAPERTIKQTASAVSAKIVQYLTGTAPAAAAK